MHGNSETEETGFAAGACRDSALGVTWLANKIGLNNHARARPFCARYGASRNAWLYSYNASTVPLATPSNPSAHAPGGRPVRYQRRTVTQNRKRGRSLA
jgi:hypothetical protein